MKKLMAVMAALAASTTIAMAQDEAAAAKLLLLPMLQETAPGPAGEVLTNCIIATSTPEELTAFAVAPGPSMEIGAAITAILTRPEATTCISEAAPQ